MNFTVFTDESGEFSNPTGPLGKHITVAVVLPWERSVADSRAAEALSGANVPLPFHASGTTFPPSVARTLFSHVDRASHRCSPELQQMLTNHGAHDANTWWEDEHTRLLWSELKQIGARWLNAARTAASRLIEQGGSVFVCLQHGGAPETAQWERMMQAVVEEVLFSISMRKGSPHTLDVVIADRGGRLPFDFNAALELLQAARKRGVSLASVASHRRVPTINADESPGVQIADIVAHGLGPGAFAYQEVSSQEARQFDFGALRREARTWMSVRATGTLHPGGARAETHGQVVGAIQGLGISTERNEARMSALDEARVNLPDYTYLCSVQGALKLVKALSSQACTISTTS